MLAGGFLLVRPHTRLAYPNPNCLGMPYARGMEPPFSTETLMEELS